tara:strand:- start:988 stop:1575 length:588 start_codon:yes stop_codon:yes gene_type:complete
MKNLHLIDFDGTLSNKDSSKFFFKTCLGIKFYYYYYVYSFGLILKYFLRVETEFEIKKKRYSLLAKKSNKKKLQYLIQNSDKFVEKIIRPKARLFLSNKKKHEDEIIIVSAGLSIFLEKWAEKNSLDLLTNEVKINNSNELEFLYTYDCNNSGKVKRINNHVNIKAFDKIYAYGDSDGDFEMFAVADDTFYKPFN